MKKRKNTQRHMTQGMALGMCFGVSIGTSLGMTLFDNMALGSAMGLSIGMILGMLIGAEKDKEVNAQIEEQGYTIQNISEQEEGFRVVLRNRAGEETIVTVPAGTMETEKFCIGDMVFLDEDGEIEQAFDTED